MSAFFGVSFISMDMGLMISIGLALVRSLLYIARPATCKLGNIPNSNLYRDMEQYPIANGTQGILTLQLGSPIYFANADYMKERIMRWIREERDNGDVEYVLLEMGGVSVIDVTGVESLLELRRSLVSQGIKMKLINPRLEVMEKLVLSKCIDTIGKENVFLSVEDAIVACRYSLQDSEAGF